MHMVIPSKYSVSFAVGTIKKNTNRTLREKFWFLDKIYWGSRQHLVNRVFCAHGWDYGGDHQPVRFPAKDGGRGQVPT
ncbi:MAG: hypothetical protein KF722_13325 [Nitrospira sp.]|nr:hypothetical protein [Nitrospira sp.]